MVVGSVLLDPVAGAEVLTALSAASAPVSGDTRTACQRNADALTDICRQYLATAEDRKSGGGHPHLIVTVDADSLTGEPGSPGSGGLAGGDAGLGRADQRHHRAAGRAATPTSPWSRWAVRAARGRSSATRRFFTTAQRVAMIARDGDRCAVPYCDRPWPGPTRTTCSHWAPADPTVIDNGALPAPRTTRCSTKATGPCTATTTAAT